MTVFESTKCKKMKNLYVFCLIAFLTACNSQENSSVNALNLTKVENDVSQMSIHLFDLPSTLSEEEYLIDVEKLNAFFIDAGYGKNYTVLKVKSKDGSSNNIHQYALVSSYTSPEHYDESHTLGVAYDDFMDLFKEKYQEVIDDEIYRKVYTIN